jgi:hypothetical protein
MDRHGEETQFHLSLSPEDALVRHLALWTISTPPVIRNNRSINKLDL